MYCPGKYCFSREKYESPDGYVTTPRSIYGCGNCVALFVHKVPFTLQEQVKAIKTDNRRFFLKEPGTQQTTGTSISINQL